jgi:hypothetical protein
MSWGFIITRHVNSEMTYNYFLECYNCIRRIYKKEKIIIIDDNSNPEFLNDELILPNLVNCQLIHSEYPQAGELLAYFYFHKFRFFSHAVIIHDSTFIRKRINFSSHMSRNVTFFWHFLNKWDKDEETLSLINESSLLNKERIISLYKNKGNWWGWFGIQGIISLPFLDKLQEKYNLFSLLHCVRNRKKRCCMERIMAVIVTLESEEIFQRKSIYGTIHDYQRWGYKYTEYLRDKKQLGDKDIIKVWTGR